MAILPVVSHCAELPACPGDHARTVTTDSSTPTRGDVPERLGVWEYRAGESNDRHRQEEQEELYVVLSGRFEMVIEGETIDLGTGDVVVEPDAWRQLTAREDARLLAVGAPNVADDGVVHEE